MFECTIPQCPTLNAPWSQEAWSRGLAKNAKISIQVPGKTPTTLSEWAAKCSVWRFVAIHWWRRRCWLLIMHIIQTGPAFGLSNGACQWRITLSIRKILFGAVMNALIVWLEWGGAACKKHLNVLPFLKNDTEQWVSGPSTLHGLIPNINQGQLGRRQIAGFYNQ